jgi:5'-nucleotidase
MRSIVALALLFAALAAPASAETVPIQLLGLNDLHGNLEPPQQEGGAPLGGVAWLAAHLRRERAANPRGTVVVHAGDVVGGSPLESSWFHDEPTIEALNLMGFDVGTIGNHELDEGRGEMLRLIHGGHRADGLQDAQGLDTSGAMFGGAAEPYVSANVVPVSGPPLFHPYVVVRRRGVRVGVIGVTTTETPALVDHDAVAGLRFLDLSDSVNRAVRALQRRGVHAIVVLAHAGGAEIRREAAQMSPDVDVVFAGHTHERMDERVGSRIVIEGGRYGNDLSRVRLRVRRRDGQVVSASAAILPVDHRIAPDPTLARLVAARRVAVAPIADRVVAFAAGATTRSQAPTGESALGELVARAERLAAGADVGIINQGALRADLPSGPITYGQAFAVLPWGEPVVSVTLSGADLRAALAQHLAHADDQPLQFNGMTWVADGTAAADVLVNGEPLDDARDYRVALTARLAEGADHFSALDAGRDRAIVGPDVDVLIAGLGAMPQPLRPISVSLPPRIERV